MKLKPLSLKQAGRWLIIILIVWFIIRFFIQNTASLKQIGVWLPARWLGISLLSGMVGWLFLTYASWLLLRQLKQSVSWLAFARSYMKGNLARYIPGGIWGYAYRYQEGKRIGLQRGPLLYASLFEIAAILITGLLAGINLLPFSWPIRLIGLLISFIILIGIASQYVNWIVHWLANKLKRETFDLPSFKITGWSLAGIILTYFGVWLSWGTALWAISRGWTDAVSWSQAFGGFALAFTAGYAAVFIPSGLGVREGILTAQLALIVPIALAGLIAAWSRLLFSISELIAYGLLWIFNHFSATTIK